MASPFLEFRQSYGPYRGPIVIEIEFLGRCGQCLVTMRNSVDQPREALEDDTTVILKLPAASVGVLELKEVVGGGFTTRFEVIPSSVDKETLIDPDPDPITYCMDHCPPYYKECPPNEVPDCVNNKLECVAKAKLKDS